MIDAENCVPTAKLIGSLLSMNTTKEETPLRVLLDTGSFFSVISHNFVTEFPRLKDTLPVRWSTKSATFVTKNQVSIHFKLPEFSDKK